MEVNWFKGLIVRAPKTADGGPPTIIVWRTPEQVIDDLAKDIFDRRWQGEKSWQGRKTNRAYYRRLARAELARRNKGTGK